MPRVNLSDLNNYNSGGSKFKKVPYMSLKDDGDSVQVHFLLDSADDLNECIYITHNVKLKSAPKLKYGVRVNCLREYNDPIEDCPFCREGIQTNVSCVLPVYNVDADEVEFWTRGKKEANRLFKKIAKYKNFSEHLFEITRNGEENDQSTDYEYEHLGEEELPDVEVPEILGTAVLDKSYDDMEYWLDEKDFPPEDDDDDDEEDEPVRRRPSKSHKEEEPVRRRPTRKVEEEDEEDPPFDEDEEEEPVRRRPTGGRKARRRSAEDEF